MSKKVIARVNQCIINALEEGTVPWRSPYVPHQSSNGHRYKGYNAWILNHVARKHSYTSPVWWTAKAAFKKGGNLAGKKATTIRYFSLKKKKDNPEDTYMFARLYWVFNSDQVDWPDDHEEPEPIDFKAEHTDVVAKYISAHPIEVTTVPGMAFYNPSSDIINIPEPRAMLSTASWYPTMFHEMAHSTGHKSRLNRKGIAEMNMLNDHTYSLEELVAEFTSAYLCGYTGMSMDHLDQSAAYINGWLSKIKDEPNILDKATREAEKAFQYITGVTDEV